MLTSSDIPIRIWLYCDMLIDMVRNGESVNADGIAICTKWGIDVIKIGMGVSG